MRYEELLSKKLHVYNKHIESKTKKGKKGSKKGAKKDAKGKKK